MFSCSVQPTLQFSQVRKTCETCRIAVAAAQSLILIALAPIRHTQTADPANLLSDLAAAANPSPAVNANQVAEPTGGGPLRSIVVTSYLIPRVGPGPQA